MKVKYFWVTVLMGIMVMAFGNAAVMADEITTTGEEETTFDYSKMDKNFQYKEGWEDYYDISFCSNVNTSKTSYSYTGKEVKPAINVQVHDTKSSKVNKALDKKYYTVEWKNNINPGTAIAIVKGINGFYGEKKITFKIKMPNITIKSVKSVGKQIKIKVKKLNIEGVKYQVRYKKNTGKEIPYKVTDYKNGEIIGHHREFKTTGKWKILLSNKNNIKTKKLKKGNYFLQVRSYIKINNKKYYGNWKAYNALVNVKTKKANKKNFEYNGFRSPDKFNKYYKNLKYNQGYYVTSFKISKVNGVSNCIWDINKTVNGKKKCIYFAVADKYGNLLYK